MKLRLAMLFLEWYMRKWKRFTGVTKYLILRPVPDTKIIYIKFEETVSPEALSMIAGRRWLFGYVVRFHTIHYT